MDVLAGGPKRHDSDLAAGLPERGRRTRFLALVGVLGSPVFMLGLLLTAMAALVVSPCARW